MLGTQSPRTGAVVFENTSASKRTDADFRLKRYPDHHHTRSPLLDLVNFDLIDDVIVSDRLHLIDLGVIRKLLQGWRAGAFLNVAQWSTDKCKEITDKFTQIELPSEIHRKFRTLDDIQYWKGSEYSSLLNYGSIFVLKK